MTISRTLFASTALGFSVMANTAYADLTAAEVWGDWRGYLEGMGYSVTASEATTGNTLALNDITIQIDGGPDIDEMVIGMGSLQLVENSNGTVDVVMPATMPVMIDIKPESTGSPTKIEVAYSQSGQKMTVSGDTASMKYDYKTDSFDLVLTSLLVDGEVMDQSSARVNLSGKDITSLTSMTLGQTRTYDQTMQTGNITYDFFFKDPDDIETVSVNSTVQSLTFAGTSSIPANQILQAQDLAPLLAAGFAFDGGITTTDSETKIAILSEDGETKIKTGSASGSFNFAMNTDGFHYDLASEKMQVGAEIAGLPFPLSAEMAKSGFKIRAPLMKSDDPQDFSLAFNATDFTMSDMIWAMFDPSGQLPRDAATIALDLSGKAKVLFDGLDPEAMAKIAENSAPPAELHALRIDRLIVDAVGAKLDATGDVTFDNTDTTTFSDLPKPVGEVNINLAGANGLLDKLVAMGMLPAEQVMGVRMMMGMFAVPGDAPDTLKSKIEFNEEGQILANGQRLK